jgi:hypothetical protein
MPRNRAASVMAKSGIPQQNNLGRQSGATGKSAFEPILQFL